MNEKYIELIRLIKGYKKITIAYSGGVDSNFLLHTAVEVLGKEKVLAVTIAGDMNPKRERNESINHTKILGVEHIIIDVDIDEINMFNENEKDRCYFCKKQIFEEIIKVSEKRNIKYILDGTNLDDFSDYRPGLKAIKELGVISPLKEAGLSKEEIRELSRDKNINTWDKPSMACLASRIPYNTIITKEKLNIIELCENYLEDLGYRNYRVRYHNEIARIELDKNQIEEFINSGDFEKVNLYFKEQGFIYVTLDLEGFKSGSMNSLIDTKEV